MNHLTRKCFQKRWTTAETKVNIILTTLVASLPTTLEKSNSQLNVSNLNNTATSGDGMDLGVHWDVTKGEGHEAPWLDENLRTEL